MVGSNAYRRLCSRVMVNPCVMHFIPDHQPEHVVQENDACCSAVGAAPSSCTQGYPCTLTPPVLSFVLLVASETPTVDHQAGAS